MVAKGEFAGRLLLMVLDSIQKYILKPKWGISGDYSVFASSVESLFRKSSLVALEEFGLPLQIGVKIDSLINLSEDVDLAISQLKGYEVHENKFNEFERLMIEDVKSHL